MANEFQLSFQGSAHLYVILRRAEDAAVWNGSSFVTWNDANVTSYALPLTHRGGDVYQGDFPAGIEAGQYLAIYYLRSGESPTIDDLLLTTRTIHWQMEDSDQQPEPVPVAADALTSVEAVRSYLRLSTVTQDELNLLAALVNQVSARIERICGRRFQARSWVDRHARCEQGRVMLRHYPILAMDRIATGAQEAMRITCSKADALSASVSVVFDEQGLEGQVRLRSVDASGQETNTTLSLQSCPTTALLAEAVLEVEGWSATLIRNIETQQLHAMGAIGALHRAVPLMYPDQELSHWDAQSNIGVVNLWRPMGRVVVAYRAGYETIPADLQLAATELVAQAYQQGRQNPAVKSETLGDYSYTLATQTQISDDLWSRLRLYMEVR